MRPLRVGSRKSELALIQSRSIIASLGGEAELVLIQTRGDRITDRPLNQVGGAGLFIKEMESALLDERIDLAVHSMKDMPSEIPEGLALAATTKRLDARDALVSRSADSLASLPWQPRHRPSIRGLSGPASIGCALQRHRRGALGRQQELAHRCAFGGMVRCLHQLQRPGYRTETRQKWPRRRAAL